MRNRKANPEQETRYKPPLLFKRPDMCMDIITGETIYFSRGKQINNK